MAAHARFTASAAERWLNCPGSIRLIEALPPSKSRGSAAAAEGTFAHHVAATVLEDPLRNMMAKDWLGNKTIIDGHAVECDQEMVDGVQFYVDDCDADYHPDDKIWTEITLTDALAKLVHPELGGTGDRARYRPSTKHLLVVDFKYGAGVAVDVFDNKQLKMYALGVLLATGVGASRVTIRIVQPRIEHAEGRVRDYTFDAVEILDFAADVQDAIKAALAADAKLTPGPWCRKTFCPAAATCPELQRRQESLIKADFGVAPSYSVEDLGKALADIELVKARIKALEEFAYNEANRGVEIPGWKLVAKRPTRKVVDEKGLIAVAEFHGVDPYEPRTVKSPAQIEKAYAETAPRGQKKSAIDRAKALFAPYVQSISSGTALVPSTDDRQPVKQLAANAFTASEPTPAGLANLFGK